MTDVTQHSSDCDSRLTSEFDLFAAICSRFCRGIRFCTGYKFVLVVVLFSDIVAASACGAETRKSEKKVNWTRLLEVPVNSGLRTKVYCHTTMFNWRAVIASLSVEQKQAYLKAHMYALMGNRAGAVKGIRSVLGGSVNSMQYLRLWRFLRLLGEEPDKRDSRFVVGVVVESHSGLNDSITAIYRDGTVIAKNSECRETVGRILTERMRMLLEGIWEQAAYEVERATTITNHMPYPPKRPGFDVIVALLTTSGNFILRINGKEGQRINSYINQWVILATRELLFHNMENCVF